jgi:ADP-ribosylglycohydrolase
MIGAIAGDIIGSIYEHHNIKTTNFPLFSDHCQRTDDSMLTLATAKAVLRSLPYDEVYREFYRKDPVAGYGQWFQQWAQNAAAGPYQSYGNGAPMRVSPVAYATTSLPNVIKQAKLSAQVTHDHPEGIKGATAMATGVFLALHRRPKSEIRSHLSETFGYSLDFTINDIRADYRFDVSCQGSVPQAIVAFLDGKSFEDCVRLAISIGGDSDTIGCMTGALAGAYHGVPKGIQNTVQTFLEDDLLTTLHEFGEAFPAIYRNR